MTPSLRTVVVLYRPDTGAIESIERLAAAGYGVIAVANEIDATSAARLDDNVDVVTVRNATNIGLAKALNQGIARAIGDGADFVLLLDQDSRPSAAMATELLAVAQTLIADGVTLGCVAPTAIDRKGAAGTAGQAIVERPSPATVITSGAILASDAVRSVGGMWEELFIDGIDHEWCFRARAAGFAVERTPRVLMEHDMGDDGITIAGRYRPIHRSPVRHYHIVRNILWTARLEYVPISWRLKEIVKLAYRVPTYLLASTDRGATLRAVMKAIADGMKSSARTIRS